VLGGSVAGKSGRRPQARRGRGRRRRMGTVVVMSRQGGRRPLTRQEAPARALARAT
jgi:hypothetical protein